MSERTAHYSQGLGTLLLLCVVGLIAYLTAPYVLSRSRRRSG